MPPDELWGIVCEGVFINIRILELKKTGKITCLFILRKNL